MKLDAPSMAPYTVFPDWVFEGKLELNREQQLSIIEHASMLDKVETHYGWTTKFTSVRNEMLTLSNLVGNMFFDNVVSHFALPEKLRDISVTDNQFTMVKPGHVVPSNIVRMRWYTGVVFVDGDANSSKLYFDMLNTKLYSTPSPLIQQFTHFIDYQPMKVVFFPAHIPWGFSPNLSQKPSLFYTFSFHIIPPDQKKR